MSGPTIGEAPRVRAPFDARCYYKWVEPNSEVTIFLNSEAMDRLQTEAFHAVDSGREVGGVLRGWTEWNEDRVQIVVEDFEIVPFGSDNSPFYNISSASRKNLAAALDRSGPLREAVGYYRSHNRAGIYLSTDDLRLIEEHFPGTENVFLLIKMLPSRACTAGFFFRKDGRIRPEFTDSEVPLIPPAAGCRVTDLQRGKEEDQTAAALRVLKPLVVHHRLAYGALLAAVLASFTVVIHDRALRERPRTNASNNSSVDVRSALPVPSSDRAPAARTQAPASVPRALAERRSDPKHDQAVPPAGGESKTPLRRVPAEPSKTRGPAFRQATDSAITESPSGTETSAPPSLKPAAAALDVQPGPPAARVPDTPIVASPPSAEKPLPVNPAPTPLVTPPPAPAAISEPAGGAAPPVPSTFIGPRVIHQVAPAVPHEVRPRITTDVELRVEVTISATGKVTTARVMSAKGAAAGLLTIEALKAAQLFRFQPAQENGHTIPSVMLLTFRFEATAKPK